ncbi:MAG: flagellar FlbD family protein [Miltoncostaeaceae bacterium]
MIRLHKLNGDEFVLNAYLMISVEATPDTLISMIDRRSVMVGESVAEVVAAVFEYRSAVLGGRSLHVVGGGS